MSKRQVLPRMFNLAKGKFNIESLTLRSIIIVAIALPLCVNFLLINLLYFTNNDIQRDYQLALESQNVSANAQFLHAYLAEMEAILNRGTQNIDSASKVENDFFIIFNFFNRKIENIAPLIKKGTKLEGRLILVQQKIADIYALKLLDEANFSIPEIWGSFMELQELVRNLQVEGVRKKDKRSQKVKTYIEHVEITLIWFLVLILMYYMVIGFLLKKSFFTTLGRILYNLQCAKNETFTLPEPKSKKSELSVVEHEIFNLYRKLEDRRLENQAFVYSVSHDLRSPLLSIQSFVKELNCGVNNIETELSKKTDLNFDYLNKIIMEFKESIGFVNISTSKITAIIESLLMLSRAGKVSLHIEEINLEAKLTTIIQSIEAEVRSSKSKIILNELPLVYSDRNALNQIFLNLITNSIKYKHPERDLILEIGLDTKKTDDKFYAIFIKDNGSGIDLNYLDKIFLPFGQQKTTSKASTGLGLSIVKRYIDRTGGRLSVDSVVGSGTTFTIYVLREPRDTLTT